MKTIDQIKDCQAIELGYNSFRDLVINPKQDMQVYHLSLCVERSMEEYAKQAISQMQPELSTLKRHDKQLRSWINSMAYEIKVLKTALKDTQEFSSDDQLSEWLFDQDYHTQVIIKDKIECNQLPISLQPEWVAVATMTLDQKMAFNRYDKELVLCRFDNGRVMRYNEGNLPFAEMTDVFFIPQPPTNKP